VIFIGIDDTDIIGTPGTNQLARLILKRLGGISEDSVICRHQLFFDTRVPYTSKNGSASIQLPHADTEDRNQLIQTIREVMQGWFVVGSDPGLCIAAGRSAEISEEVRKFAIRCKSEVVSQDEAREVAAKAGCYLEGLGGTEQGVVGALAAVGLIAGGDDGRVVQLSHWPYPDDAFTGPCGIDDLHARGIDEVRILESGEQITRGSVDIGKHLRPNLRGGRIVLYVNASNDRSAGASWQAVKLP
jgi:hypothetical protein